MSPALIKTAELNRNTLRFALLGAGGVSTVAGVLYHLKLLKEIRALAKAKRQVRSYAKDMGVPGEIRNDTQSSLQNAFYRPREAYWLENRAQQLIGSKPTREDLQGERTGSLTFGGSFRKPAIIAHELGHASIGNEAWYSPSRLNQVYGRLLSAPASVVANIASPLVGAGMYGVMRNYTAGLPGPARTLASLAGSGLTSAAIGGLAGLPVLLNEWQASARAKDMLAKDPTLTAAEKAKSDKALNRAFGSYVMGSTLFPALGGTIGAASQEF